MRKLGKMALYAWGYGGRGVRLWACVEAGVHVRARWDVA